MRVVSDLPGAFRPVHCIGVASSLGAADFGCAEGPQVLRERGLVSKLRRGGVDAAWRAMLLPDEAGGNLQRLAVLGARLAHQVEQVVRRGERALVLGGDHSCAVGTWRGAARALGVSGRGTARFGLIWIDAHLDAHVPETTPSNNLHGMPLAALLGQGAPEMAGIEGPLLAPESVCVLGVRSFEAEEALLLALLGVRVFDMEEIGRRGLTDVLQDALTIARRDTDAFGVTLDLDAIDPRDAPAVGTPVAEGLRAEELLAALRVLRGCEDLVAFEIAEFDPNYDRDGKTARLITDLADAVLAPDAAALMAMERRYGARNYDPLPVALARGEGAWVWDVDGKRYLDMMSAYSAASFGHCHPRLTSALARQAQRLGVTSRAYYNDRLPLLLKRLCALTGFDQALPVNTGLEAVETALKAARKWAYTVKGVAAEAAEIIVCEGNFHGRSIAIVGFSSEPQYRDGFGPFPAGFKRVPFGDADALEAAIGANTAAFLVEPVQGEGGIIVPPPGYLARCAEICRRHNVLLLCDEVQTGLGRTGRLLACQHDAVRPDGVILGKALGGGLLPVSAFLARREVMQVFRPGDHGSTFGGNPLAAAVALETLEVLADEHLVERAAALGEILMKGLDAIDSPLIREVRGLGLLVGMEVDGRQISARTICDHLLARGLLTRDTHETVIRFAPPLVVSREQIEWAVRTVRDVFEILGSPLRKAA